MALLGVQCRKTPPGLLRLGARGTLLSPSATRQGGALAAAARSSLTSSAPSLPRRRASAWLSGSMRFQRLHAATFRGVAMLMNSRPVMRMGPEVPQKASSLPVPPPAPAAGD